MNLNPNREAATKGGSMSKNLEFRIADFGLDENLQFRSRQFPRAISFIPQFAIRNPQSPLCF